MAYRSETVLSVPVLCVVSHCAFPSLVFPCELGSAVFSWPLVIDCIIPQAFIIVCRIYPHFLCYLNPIILCQIEMYPVSFIPAFICMTWPVLCTLTFDFRFCILFCLDSLFLDPAKDSALSFSGIPFRCVERIALTFGFSSLPATRITNWIISVETVCWKIDPVSGHSLCSWVVCITLICPIFICIEDPKTGEYDTESTMERWQSEG